jgi:hypothetical protein
MEPRAKADALDHRHISRGGRPCRYVHAVRLILILALLLQPRLSHLLKLTYTNTHSRSRSRSYSTHPHTYPYMNPYICLNSHTLFHSHSHTLALILILILILTFTFPLRLIPTLMFQHASITAPAPALAQSDPSTQSDQELDILTLPTQREDITTQSPQHEENSTPPSQREESPIENSITSSRARQQPTWSPLTTASSPTPAQQLPHSDERGTRFRDSATTRTYYPRGAKADVQCLDMPSSQEPPHERSRLHQAARAAAEYQTIRKASNPDFARAKFSPTKVPTRPKLRTSCPHWPLRRFARFEEWKVNINIVVPPLSKQTVLCWGGRVDDLTRHVEEGLRRQGVSENRVEMGLAIPWLCFC